MLEKDSGSRVTNLKCIDSRVALGLAIVALGVVLTVLTYSTHEAWSTQRFWPLLVVGFGVMRITEQSSRIEGWVLVIVGGGVLLSNFGLFVLPAREVVRYWPLSGVMVGLSEMVLSRSMGA